MKKQLSTCIVPFGKFVNNVFHMVGFNEIDRNTVNIEDCHSRQLFMFHSVSQIRFDAAKCRKESFSSLIFLLSLSYLSFLFDLSLYFSYFSLSHLFSLLLLSFSCFLPALIFLFSHLSLIFLLPLF